MRIGQRVRVRPSSHVARDWHALSGALGIVVCTYKILGKFAAERERIDVRFPSNRMVWGRPADGFEEIADQNEQHG